MPVKIVASFNYKGGVTKTTSVINIGTKLAMDGRRVGLVDIDTQCNLSSCYLPEPMQAAENPEEDDDVELEQEEPQGGNCRYKSRLSPMFSQHWNLTLLVLASQPSLLNLW